MQLGQDETEPAPSQLWRAIAMVRIGLEVLLLVGALVATALLWVFATPGGLQRVVDQLVGDAPFDVTVGDVELLPTTELLAPRTWRVAVVGIDIEPDDPGQPRIQADRVLLGVPDLIEAWFASELHFESVRVIGLDVHLRSQRPPAPWEPKDTALDAIRAAHAQVWDAHFHADADAPLPAVDAERIYGDLTDVHYAPSKRELSGTGLLRGASFRSGAIEVEEPAVQVLANRSDLVFDGSFLLYGTPATAHGEVMNLHKRAEVQIQADAGRVPVERVISTGSGNPSPLIGPVQASFMVLSGGDRRRGGAETIVDAVMAEGLLDLGEGISGLATDLLRLAPFADLDDQGRIHLGRSHARLRIDRKQVEIVQLLYETPRRILQMWGTVGPSGMEVYVRLVPTLRPGQRAGIGLVLTRPDGKLKVAFANKTELEHGIRLSPGAGPAETRDPDQQDPKVKRRRARAQARGDARVADDAP